MERSAEVGEGVELRAPLANKGIIQIIVLQRLIGLIFTRAYIRNIASMA